MTRWETLESWLFENRINGGRVGNSHELAEELGISSNESSAIIQSHLEAQRSPRSRTLYILRRKGRTSRAVWYSGIRTVDSRAAGETFFEDVDVKFRKALAPDLQRIAARNPRAAKQCERIVDAVGNSAMTMLRIAVGLGDDDDDDGGGVIK